VIGDWWIGGLVIGISGCDLFESHPDFLCRVCRKQKRPPIAQEALVVFHICRGGRVVMTVSGAVCRIWVGLFLTAGLILGLIVFG